MDLGFWKELKSLQECEKGGERDQKQLGDGKIALRQVSLIRVTSSSLKRRIVINTIKPIDFPSYKNSNVTAAVL